MGKAHETAIFLGYLMLVHPHAPAPHGMPSDVLLEYPLMTKSFEVISEAVRNAKHAFAKAANYTKKPLHNRYERRKVRNYLALTDWMLETSD